MNTEKIKSTIETDIQMHLQLDFFLLLDYLKDEKSKCTSEGGKLKFPKEFPKEFSSVTITLIDTVKGLEAIFENPDLKSETLDKFIKIKEDFATAIKPIIAYTNQLNRRLDFTNHYITILEYDKQQLPDLPPSALFDMAMNFVNGVSLSPEEPQIPGFSYLRASFVLSTLPMKMTREKYFDYIEENLRLSLATSDSESADKYIEGLSMIFCPQATPHHGKLVPEIAAFLDQISESDLSKQNYENLHFHKRILTTSHERHLSPYLGYITEMLETINCVINILTFAPTLDYLLGDELLNKDVFYSTRNHLNDNLIPEELEILTDNVQEVSRILLSKLNKIKPHSIEAHKKAAKEPNEELSRLISADKKIRESALEDMSDLVHSSLPAGTGKPMTDKELDKKINAFIKFCRDSLRNFSPREGRLMRQFFLRALPYPHDESTFKEFLSIELDELSPTEMKSVTGQIVILHASEMFT